MKIFINPIEYYFNWLCAFSVLILFCSMLMNSGIEPPSEDDVCAEIFDMAGVSNVQNPIGITFKGSLSKEYDKLDPR